MTITISPVIADITIGGLTFTHSDWEENTPGVLSALGNAIGGQIATLDLVGMATVAMSGTTYLSSDQATNLVFRLTGALSGTGGLTFPDGWVGFAAVLNQTSGGFPVNVSMNTGDVVQVPAGGSANIVFDGDDAILVDGVRRTSTGAEAVGTFNVTGALTALSGSITNDFAIGGTLTVVDIVSTGDVSFLEGTISSLGVAEDVGIAGDLAVLGTFTSSGDFDIGGTGFFSGGRVDVAHASSESRLGISGAAGNSAWVEYDTTALQRWLIGKNATVEAGSNVGSDFDFVRTADDGVTILGIPMRIRRSDGGLFFFELPTTNPGAGTAQMWCDTTDGNTLKLA